jgi:hypothetical protein
MLIECKMLHVREKFPTLEKLNKLLKKKKKTGKMQLLSSSQIERNSVLNMYCPGCI